MEKVFAIDFIRQVIYQTLVQENHKYPNKYIGNPNDLSLISFYEHLLTNEEVNRFVETVKDLNDQQNRLGLIANGVILAPSNPTITNLNQSDIIPLDFTISFRITLENRDSLLETLHHLISLLKGRKVDVAELDTGKLFLVGTMCNNSVGEPLIKDGDYIGEVAATSIDDFIRNGTTGLYKKMTDNGCVFENYENGAFINGSYFYFKDLTSGQLSVAYFNGTVFSKVVDNHQDYPNIMFPDAHNSFKKYCISISFDSERCNEPRTLNAINYCELSFGGSATLVSSSVMLGNQMSKLGIKRFKLVKSDDGNGDTIYEDNYTWLEPLEIPSGANAETHLNQLLSNRFITNSHTDSLSITNQYTFVIDENINLLKQFFKYARYGIQTYITPNIIYSVIELSTKWGVVEFNEFKAKIIESVDIEQTESDTLTIALPMQIQGDNN